jgi:starch synthase (maltosyl-transferring)
VLPRITIADLRPSTPAGLPAKGTVGEAIPVSATIFRDGHDLLTARARWRSGGSGGGSRVTWETAALTPVGNDGWTGSFAPSEVGPHELTIEAWTDRYGTWAHDVRIKHEAGDDIELELEEGARILETLEPRAPAGAQAVIRSAIEGLRRTACAVDVRLEAGLDPPVLDAAAGIPTEDLTTTPTLPLWVDRPRAGFGAWYELFPRSEGGFAGAAKRLPAVADMGFDIVYLAPIHPIGTTARKGDYALQCSPDHPWVREHPEWFHRRPDGSIRYAENPPKKYQDIYPLNFWPADDADRDALWTACRDVLRHWIDEGIRCFRVDNPHTKPVAFWAWLLPDLQREHPDLIFLAEAFTRPKVMARLAEVGFTQSYTYFTWRTEPWELRQYVEELAFGPTADYMRPSFWPNTPDILAGPLRDGPAAAFRLRFVLAATLVPTYGMYSGYELYENQPASETNEEYFASEKYEIKRRDWARADSMAPFIAQVNEIRRRHPGFRSLRDIRFHHSSNERFLAYSRGNLGEGPPVLIVVNSDPQHAQETTLGLDLDAMGLPHGRTLHATDELTGTTYDWSTPDPYIRLDPAAGQVAHILSLRA